MVRIVRLGGTASDIGVANISHGLMHMTVPEPVSDEQAFKAIKDGVDAARGAKVYLNSGSFYGPNAGPDNLELLARFMRLIPRTQIGLCFASRSGGSIPSAVGIAASEEKIRQSVDGINARLRGTKRLDVYENARVDPNRSIEETIAIMKKLIEEGKFDHIGMSECNADTLRKANAVHPIAHIEIEVSPFYYGDDTRKAIATAAELKIPVLAYSPQGGGFLTGAFRSVDDLPPNDLRIRFDRFQPENIHHNHQLVDRLAEVAKTKGVTPGQLSIAWVLSLGPHMLPLPGSSHFKRTLENLAAGEIVLTPEEQKEINAIIDAIPIRGQRYLKGTGGLML